MFLGLLKNLLLLLSLFGSTQVQAFDFSNSNSAQTILASALPVEARATLQLIKQGEPFPYPRDGVVFGNYERRLPQQPRGYYHEYTVMTPGARTRGARRIVCGPLPECYYTPDHYRTFLRIGELP